VRILVDVAHPAHVHFFKHALRIWAERGHEIVVVARDKDVTLELLERLSIPYRLLSTAAHGAGGLAVELVVHQARLLAYAARSRPDVMLNIGGVTIVHAAALLRVPAIVLTDTEHARLSNRITFPFATRIFTPECFQRDLGPRHIRYAGYHELAYLHPDRFTPDPGVLKDAGVDPDERLFLVRFVSWGAAHDRGHSGLARSDQVELVRRLSEHGRVFVTTEGALPPHLEEYRLPVATERIHDLLAFCTMYVGEGATMASEAALLGCMALYVNPLRLGYLDELEKRYGMVRCVAGAKAALEAADELASRPELRSEMRDRRRRLLSERVDVTQWLVEAVEAEMKGRG